MKATQFEFRYRFWILVAVFALGFAAPWDYALRLDGAGPNTHVWGQLAIALSCAGMEIAMAFRVVLIAGIVLAFAGAWLRTWATANLGPEVMRSETLRGAALVAQGPYRYVRNPLYLGLWLNALALALLMPPSGAVFLIAALVLFQVRLMLAEEAWLRERLGAAYVDYCARVGRIVPRLRTRGDISPARSVDGAPVSRPRGRGARWGRAALAEIFLWGTAVSFAVLGWEYNAHLLIQAVLVSLGMALVAQGLDRRPPAATEQRVEE